jgi:hypothetical protein
MRPGYKSRQAEARERRKSSMTSRCIAVGLDGPCKNWTETPPFCHAHEWRNTQLVMSARQSFVLLLPLVVQRLRHAIQDADNETALKAILVYWKMQGDRPVTEGIPTANEFADLSNEELMQRAEQAISALRADNTGAAADSTETAQNGPRAVNGTPDGPGSAPQQAGSEGLESSGNG